MHHHHWDAWLHFPIAAIVLTMRWWTDYFSIEGAERHLTFLVGITVGILQVAYLIRKHWNFEK